MYLKRHICYFETLINLCNTVDAKSVIVIHKYRLVMDKFSWGPQLSLRCKPKNKYLKNFLLKTIRIIDFGIRMAVVIAILSTQLTDQGNLISLFSSKIACNEKFLTETLWLGQLVSPCQKIIQN